MPEKDFPARNSLLKVVSQLYLLRREQYNAITVLNLVTKLFTKLLRFKMLRSGVLLISGYIRIFYHLFKTLSTGVFEGTTTTERLISHLKFFHDGKTCGDDWFVGNLDFSSNNRLLLSCLDNGQLPVDLKLRAEFNWFKTLVRRFSTKSTIFYIITVIYSNSKVLTDNLIKLLNIFATHDNTVE